MEISDQRGRNSAYGEVPPVSLICFTHTTFHNLNFSSCSSVLAWKSCTVCFEVFLVSKLYLTTLGMGIKSMLILVLV